MYKWRLEIKIPEGISALQIDPTLKISKAAEGREVLLKGTCSLLGSYLFLNSLTLVLHIV